MVDVKSDLMLQSNLESVCSGWYHLSVSKGSCMEIETLKTRSYNVYRKKKYQDLLQRRD